MFRRYRSDTGLRGGSALPGPEGWRQVQGGFAVDHYPRNFGGGGSGAAGRPRPNVGRWPGSARRQSVLLSCSWTSGVTARVDVTGRGFFR